jgi:nitroreductase
MNEMKIETPLEQIIAERRSRRTFDERPIESDTYNLLSKACDVLGAIDSPFGERASFGILDKKATSKEPIRLGTYGMLKNPRYFLYGAIAQSCRGFVSFGYLFEQLILRATDLGLSTCWFGYFQRSSFLSEITPQSGAVVPAVSPVGYAAERSSVYERVIRSIRRPSVRSPWKKLFFSRDFAHPLEDAPSLDKMEVAGAGDFAQVLEMVRLGPSAGNLQPWRIVVRPDPLEFLFYLDRTDSNSGYSKRNLQALDIGIAMCHFDLMSRRLKLSGNWIEDPVDIPRQPGGTEFIIGWQAASP